MSLPITLAMMVKNNEKSIDIAIRSVYAIISEIVIVDTGSSDRTLEIISKYKPRVYKVPFTDFGSIRTLTVHLATQPWILTLDSDEIICKSELYMFELLMSRRDIDAWGLPRRRWADLQMNTQEEIEAYPDYQYRFIQNNKKLYYACAVHECLVGATKTHFSSLGPHIEHFQNVFKTKEQLKQREELYIKLYQQDIQNGIIRNIPAISNIDKDYKKNE